MKVNSYYRKAFPVSAVEVTAENMYEVAAWCEGYIHHDPLGKHIKVDASHPMNKRQTKAYVGDWVLSSGRGFKVYKADAFKRHFLDNTEDWIGKKWGEIEEEHGNVFQTEPAATGPVVSAKDAIRGMI